MRLKLYLHETTQELHHIVDDRLDPISNAPKRGFLKYEHWFRRLHVLFDYAPVSVELIREIIETRNLIQHPESIALMHAHQNAAAQNRFPRPFFAHPIDKAIAEREPAHNATLLWVTRDALLHSINAVEAFCNWIDTEIWATTRVGVVTHYFPKRRVAAVKLAAEVSVGQIVRFRRQKVNFEQEIASMQIHNNPIATAPAGVTIGIEVASVRRKTRKLLILQGVTVYF